MNGRIAPELHAGTWSSRRAGPHARRTSQCLRFWRQGGGRLLRAGLGACALLLALRGASLWGQTNFAVLATDGAWTWFNDPRAFFSNGTLFFSYNRFADGRVVLDGLNLQTGSVTNLWVSTQTAQDDHNVAGLLRKQDGTLLAIYSRHGNDQFFNYRLSSSTNPVSPADWGAEQRLTTGTNVSTGMSYSNPYQLAGEAGKVYNFARYENFNPNVFTSTNGGSTWSAPQVLILTGTNNSIRPYVKYCSDYQQRVDFLYTDGHPDSLPTSLYHLFYQGGAFYRTDGSFLKAFANLPILHDAGERGSVIYPYNTAAQADPNQWIPTARAWCWEVGYQSNSAPCCVFQTKVDGVTGTNWYDARVYYYYARWTGTNWQRRFIAQGGRPLYDTQPDYGGGMCLDPLDPSTVYLATDAASPFDLTTTTNIALGSHYELWKGVTTNGGLGFAWQAITTNSTVDNLRPYIPRRLGGDPCVLWFRGTYTSYTSFGCSIVGLFATPPTQPLPPMLTQSPVSVTNAYVGDTVAFTGQASGALPLVYQWWLNGKPLSALTNPSAATASLALTNVQLTDAGAYTLTVTNSGGAVTSAPAQLVVRSFPSAVSNFNQTALRLQFIAAVAYTTPASHQQFGWQTMSLNSGPTTFNGGVKVTLSALGGATLTDRDRAVQGGYPLATNNPPVMTTANLYNSFVFDLTPTVGTGIDIRIQNLTPNGLYGVNLWSFASSSGGRISDWTEALSGRSIARQYVSPTTVPTADYDATLGALLVADATGQLDLQGTFDAGSAVGSVNVFLNAMEITANPIPQIQSATMGTNGNLVLSARGQFSGQSMAFQESPDLVHWQMSTHGLNLTRHGPMLKSEFPISSNRVFFRLAAVP